MLSHHSESFDVISKAILETTCSILVDSLGVSPDEVTSRSYLIDDLGAESIDFLDIFQQAEERLGIRITEADIAPELRPREDDPDWEDELSRPLTDAQLDKLRERLPESVHERIIPGLLPYEIIRLINVEALARYFQEKVNGMKLQEE